jgi:hypothetical protein
MTVFSMVTPAEMQDIAEGSEEVAIEVSNLINKLCRERDLGPRHAAMAALVAAAAIVGSSHDPKTDPKTCAMSAGKALEQLILALIDRGKPN